MLAHVSVPGSSPAGAGDAFVEAEIAVMSFEDRGRGFEPKKQATRS